MNTKKLKLACFSPPVMIATFFIEVFLAVFTLWRYKSMRMGYLVAVALVSLSVFQIAEWMVCEGAFGLSSYQWAQIGYIAITLLPPLGIHIGMEIRGKYNPVILGLSYFMAISFVVYFLAVTGGIAADVCLGNYVIFDMAPSAVRVFSVYYYAWLLVGLGSALWFAKQEKDMHIASALRGLAVGYVSFILPVTVANLIDPTTIRGIPSIMCGFAVIFAIILVQWVVPQYCLSSQVMTKK
jgi:hypothetical protein